MARPLRISYPLAYHHVMIRGNNQEAIFYSSKDYERFLTKLCHYRDKLGFKLIAYCLMTNHVHLLLRMGRKYLLPDIMQPFLTSVTVDINRRHKRVGHLFQGRYKSLVVEKEPYLLELSCYIHLNPVRAGVVKEPGGYKYSSYKEYISGCSRWTLCEKEEILSFFGKSKEDQVKGYRRYLEERYDGEKDLLSEVEHQAVLGSKKFVQRILEKYGL